MHYKGLSEPQSVKTEIFLLLVLSLKLQPSYRLAVAFPNFEVAKPPIGLVVEHLNKGKHGLLYYSFVCTCILATIF